MATSGELLVCAGDPERAMYSRWLRGEGYRVVEAQSTAEAIKHHQRWHFHLALAELTSSAVESLELIRAVRTITPQSNLLMLGAETSVCAAVAAMKAGAVDVLLKPVERDTLLTCVRQYSAPHKGLQECQRLREELYQRYDFSQIVAHSPQMLHTLSLAGRVASRTTAVLITGESGTGKEILARAIHANSARADRPMVSINCAAIPEGLVESELFGYRRGAFTGAHTEKLGLLVTAAGGTLFLDEIFELPLSVQAKLLRFLQDGTYFELGGVHPLKADVRAIAATNAVLRERVGAGAFRSDLYYRLSVFPIHIPPLRERRQDIVPLAHHFLRRFEAEFCKGGPGLSREAVEYLTSRSWYGNVRQLENAVERAVILSSGNLLTSADFDTTETDVESVDKHAAGPWQLPENGVNLPDLNRALITTALERSGQRVVDAARLLGLSRAAMRYRRKKYGLGGSI